jgi:hypothetical protein
MNSWRRYIEVAACALAWIAAGFAFHLDPNAYLILGVPLVGLFQVLVRRQPLQKLWVRDASWFRLDLPGIALAAGMMLVPGYELLAHALPGRNWSVILWMVCCLAGALFAAFALRNQRAAAARGALPAFGMSLVLGSIVMASAALANGRSAGVPPGRVFFLLKEFLLFFPVCFVLEEVAFRGAFDSHVFDATSENRARPAWISAIFVSALWGAWHLPVLPVSGLSMLMQALPALICVHAVLGTCFSFCWRRGGTLALPAAAHALLYAYRDTVLS